MRWSGGESGIRTHGTVSRTHAFQACALNHSAISPRDSWAPQCSIGPLGVHGQRQGGHAGAVAACSSEGVCRFGRTCTLRPSSGETRELPCLRGVAGGVSGTRSAPAGLRIRATGPDPPNRWAGAPEGGPRRAGCCNFSARCYVIESSASGRDAQSGQHLYITGGNLTGRPSAVDLFAFGFRCHGWGRGPCGAPVHRDG